MRALPLVTAAALSVSIMTGCASTPENVGGEAGPAGSPSPAAGASLSASPTASPSASATASAPAGPPPATSAPEPTGGSTGAPPPADPFALIRTTDWNNVTLPGLLDSESMTFRNGKATSGDVTCTMLPGGARPAYASFLAEEPANAPSTEDAVVLVECGSDVMRQSLIPVQVTWDQKGRFTVGSIDADPSTTFASYTIDRGAIVTTVRKSDGGTETRSYRFNGGNTWRRL